MGTRLIERRYGLVLNVALAHRKFAEKLERMAKEALVDEIMIADFHPDQASRLKGYQVLAEKFDFSSKEFARLQCKAGGMNEREKAT